MHSFYLPPGNLELVIISGHDAVKLLQGQLTCDVAAIADPGFARGALCNNKGRVLATFIIVRQGTTYYLALNKDLGAVVTLAIKKYLPFYKCELRQLAADEACFGICGATAVAAFGLHEALLPAGGECRTLEPGWICNLDGAQQQYLMYSPQTLQASAGVTVAPINDWLACGAQSGQFPFEVEDVEKYTPQELHLDRHGYVSFTKGCYTGQEIVARMHYRGKLKKLLFLLEAATATAPEPMDVLDADGGLLGSTLKVLRHSNGILALAQLPADMETRLPEPVKNRAGEQFAVRVF
jgi:folate-binding protein YgfZ